jgi:hypothetical protein
MATFMAAFILLFGYNTLAISVLVLVLLMLDGTAAGAPAAFLLLCFYLVGLVYISVIWHLASVVSVLEDSKGFDAMRKSRLLIKGAALFLRCSEFFLSFPVGWMPIVVEILLNCRIRHCLMLGFRYY